jgi:DNA-binding transcriptional regulator GbsR (MarR family)
MKKTTMETILSLISDINTAEAEEVRSELEAELSKGKAKADANRALYAEMREKVLEVLTNSTTPLTAKDIAEETGLAQGKVVYGLTRLWTEEVVKDSSGKVTTYTVAKS